MSLYKVMGGYAASQISDALPFGLFSSRVVNVASAQDASKIIVRFQDGAEVEAVLIFSSSGSGATACLSSQVGCSCKCAFCATGAIPFARNLEDYEIIEQFYHLKRMFGCISNVVFMGMGEPLFNISSLTGAIKYLVDEEGISVRSITVSTSGIAKGIHHLASVLPQVKLTLSLVCADEERRRSLMPIARSNPLAEIKKALLAYQSRNRRRITLAYPLLLGENDSRMDAVAIRLFAAGLIFNVDLIPFNGGASKRFKRVDECDLARFGGYLRAAGIPFSIRRSKGGGICGACGQLALKRL